MSDHKAEDTRSLLLAIVCNGWLRTRYHQFKLGRKTSVLQFNTELLLFVAETSGLTSNEIPDHCQKIVIQFLLRGNYCYSLPLRFRLFSNFCNAFNLRPWNTYCGFVPPTPGVQYSHGPDHHPKNRRHILTSVVAHHCCHRHRHRHRSVPVVACGVYALGRSVRQRRRPVARRGDQRRRHGKNPTPPPPAG